MPITFALAEASGRLLPSRVRSAIAARQQTFLMQSSACSRLTQTAAKNRKLSASFWHATVTMNFARFWPANLSAPWSAIYPRQVFRKVWRARAMSLFPIFVKLEGRRVVVVGGGEIAAG